MQMLIEHDGGSSEYQGSGHPPLLRPGTRGRSVARVYLNVVPQCFETMGYRQKRRYRAQDSDDNGSHPSW